MYDYLVDHALKNAWCTPDQDMQAILKPARLTDPVGVFNRVEVLWRKLTLPLLKTRFHVYQIGQLHPLLMNLFPIQNTWESLAAACGLQHLIADVYSVNGVQLPRTQVWYMVTQDRNLILAVRDQPRVPINLQVEDIFLRVYSNAYFNSARANAATDVVVVQGGELQDSNEIYALQLQYTNYLSKPGLVSAYCNGLLIDRIDLINIKPGDVAEFVYDSSVKKVAQWSVRDLSNALFESTLDQKFKYLLHWSDLPGQVLPHTIDYNDDCDFFLLSGNTGNVQSGNFVDLDPAARYQGVYYHRNAADAVRNVTHRDYSVVSAYLVNYATTRGWNTEDTIVRAVIRKAGWERPLVDEDSRIKELYKLAEPISAAMVGIDATVPVWQAASLEAAGYARLMGAQVSEVNGALVEQAYGYNAISKLLANTPALTREFSGEQVVDVPYGLQTRSTAYEYDSAGLLLDWHTHVDGALYATRDLQARLVEMITGDVADRLDETYGGTEVMLDSKANYRMYRCPMVGGLPNNQWEDVTGSGVYTIVSNKLTWLLNPTEWYWMVRSDRTSLGYTLALDAADGLLQFTLTHRQLRFGVLSNWAMQIPQGELDVWLNGKALIEGLDYLVQFPKIVITNKEYLTDVKTQLQRVDVRFSGFCNPDLSRDAPDDVGFVVYGQLSHNNRFDLRDDKVMRIVCDGALYERSELVYSEDDPAVQIVDARNGAPYMIRDLVVPMRGYTDQKTYELRAHSQAIDKTISDYMTLKHPQVVQTSPSAIGTPYALYSPFVCKIMNDLISGQLVDARLKAFYNDNDVREICKPYEWILAFDPSQDTNAPDNRFVEIAPHNEAGVVDVDVYYYKFLSRVVALYSNNRVSLSHFLRIATI